MEDGGRWEGAAAVPRLPITVKRREAFGVRCRRPQDDAGPKSPPSSQPLQLRLQQRTRYLPETPRPASPCTTPLPVQPVTLCSLDFDELEIGYSLFITPYYCISK